MFSAFTVFQLDACPILAGLVVFVDVTPHSGFSY